MADKKISALPAASLPLTGTEVLPIVQAGTTDQVSVTNLTAGRAISATQLTLSTDNLVIGTAAKGITTTVTNGDINLIPLGTGVVSSVSDSVFNQIRTARAAKTVARLGTGVLTVTPVSTTSTHSSIRVDINVAFTNSSNLQYHAGYLVLTCNQGTGGGGTAIAEYFNGSVGNFVVTSANFVVTRPASGNIVITYTNTNLADPNNIEFAVTGVFASATVA